MPYGKELARSSTNKEPRSAKHAPNPSCLLRSQVFRLSGLKQNILLTSTF